MQGVITQGKVAGQNLYFCTAPNKSPRHSYLIYYVTLHVASLFNWAVYKPQGDTCTTTAFGNLSIAYTTQRIATTRSRQLDCSPEKLPSLTSAVIRMIRRIEVGFSCALCLVPCAFGCLSHTIVDRQIVFTVSRFSPGEYLEHFLPHLTNNLSCSEITTLDSYLTAMSMAPVTLVEMKRGKRGFTHSCFASCGYLSCSCQAA